MLKDFKLQMDCRWHLKFIKIKLIRFDFEQLQVLTKSVHSMRDGYIILSIYPASLVLVWTLENVFGMD